MSRCCDFCNLDELIFAGVICGYTFFVMLWTMLLTSVFYTFHREPEPQATTVNPETVITTAPEAAAAA